MKRLDIVGFLVALLIYATATGAAQPGVAGRPGTVNAIAGEVSLDGRLLNSSESGRTTLETGHVIKTGHGLAEVLLSPGSFLRLDSASELTLQKAETAEIRVQLSRGEALVEIVYAGAALVVEQHGVTASVRNPGLYDFSARRAAIAVYAGDARLNKGGKQVIANAGGGVRTRRFREFRTSPDSGAELFSWSRNRSEQLSSESRLSAQERASAGGSSAPHWHWDPWSASYTFLSASGFATGPFGWPYFSPGYTPDFIPLHRGDSWLYGPPILSGSGGVPAPAQPREPARGIVSPTVPLTAPGEPQFPTSK